MKVKVKKESVIKEKRNDILITLVVYMIATLTCYFAIKGIGYRALANGLLIIALLLLAICLIYTIKDKYVNTVFYFWKVIFANLCIFMIYVACALGLFRPIMQAVTFAILFSYIAIELIFIIIRVYWKNEKYIKNLKKNDVTEYAKKDIIISVMLIEVIIFIAKYFDINGFSSIYNAELVFLAITSPSICIILGILCVHIYAKYKYVISK